MLVRCRFPLNSLTENGSAISKPLFASLARMVRNYKKKVWVKKQTETDRYLIKLPLFCNTGVKAHR